MDVVDSGHLEAGGGLVRVSRRQSVAYLSAGLVCPLTTRLARAEPATAAAAAWTAAEIATVALAAASLLADFVSRSKERKWRRQVSAALGRIELKVDAILKGLGALRIAFNADMNRRYMNERDAFFATVRQRVNQLNELAHLSETQITELRSRVTDQDVGLIDAVTKLAKIRDDQSDLFIRHFLSRFRDSERSC